MLWILECPKPFRQHEKYAGDGYSSAVVPLVSPASSFEQVRVTIGPVLNPPRSAPRSSKKAEMIASGHVATALVGSALSRGGRRSLGRSRPVRLYRRQLVDKGQSINLYQRSIHRHADQDYPGERCKESDRGGAQSRTIRRRGRGHAYTYPAEEWTEYGHHEASNEHAGGRFGLHRFPLSCNE